MPAAPFSEAPTGDSIEHATRQWAIDPGQCRWILADEDAGAEALMCGAAAAPRRPFCAAHCARAYLKPEPEDLPKIEAKIANGMPDDAAPATAATDDKKKDDSKEDGKGG